MPDVYSRTFPGRTENAAPLRSSVSVRKFHRYLERRMAAGESVADLAEILYQKNPELVIVTDEIGCGIVPMDPFQREVREQTGRVCTALAGKARRVHRVICGIGTVIKG